jgi:hypothetical protein
MPGPELALIFVRPLNRLGIRYVISGSVAAILYGEPRLTHDVDFIVFLREAEISKLHEAFPAPEFYVPPREAIMVEMARPINGHFNVIHNETGFKADFYTAGRDDLNAWAFRSARKLDYRGESLTVAAPEYVILRKLEYFRDGGSEKHLRDIRGIMSASGESIDQLGLRELIQKYGLNNEWQKALG